MEPYSFEGALEHNVALTESLTETSFSGLIKAVNTSGPQDRAKETKHLHAAYGYLLQFQPTTGPVLFAFRRIQSAWRARKVTSVVNAFLRNRLLVSLEDKEVFQFDNRIDFFSAEEVIFILDKTGFESALNFRAGMEKKLKQLVGALRDSDKYSGLELVEKLSSSHVRWLKKLAGAQKLGKCLEQGWVQRMIAFCTAKGFPVMLQDGRVVITEDNCETIVRLMNSDLLEDPIDHDLFKIDGAKEPLSV